MNKKPSLLLHIGTEKTGTTSIQEFLAFNRVKLGQLGIHYPLCLGKTNHLKITAYAEKAPWNLASRHFGIDSQDKHETFCSNLEQNLQDELSGNDYHSAIISNEHLHSRINTPEQIQTVRELLQKFFSDIKVLVYFRRQDLMAVSLYSTALRAGHTPLRQLKFIAAKNYYYNFNAIYDNWAHVFGAENIKVRPFTREKLIEGNVLADFCVSAGLSQYDGLAATPRKNESISLGAACLIHELNERIKDGRLVLQAPRKRNQLIEKIIGLHKGEPHYPSREEAMKFFQACSEGNNALQQKLNLQLFDDDFSMYPEHEDLALYEEKRLWAKTALDTLDLNALT